MCVEKIKLSLFITELTHFKLRSHKIRRLLNGKLQILVKVKVNPFDNIIHFFYIYNLSI